MSGSTINTLPPCQRHIATHDASGKSVYLKEEAPFEPIPRPGSGSMTRSYAVSNIPAQLGNDEDLKAFLDPNVSTNVASYKRQEIVVPTTSDGGDAKENVYNGANLLVVDIQPGGSSPMHQTVSIDFSICVIGKIEHELDSGEKVTLLPGDHIVQRGTNHKWINPSQTEPARFVAVTLPCIPFEIAGQMLEQKFFTNQSPAKI